MSAEPAFKAPWEEVDEGPAIAVPALPASWYTDPQIFEIEKKRIFYKSWQCAGHECQLREPGEFITHKVVDEEIVIIRGEDRQLRAFYNVCRHRAHPVVGAASGKCRRMVCPYHAWTYDLTGRLVGAPHSRDVAGFDPKNYGLTEVRLEVFAGLIFVNLDPDAKAMDELYGSVQQEILDWKPDIRGVRLVTQTPMPHYCNWKASVENYSECYHCGPVHKYLTNEVLDADSGRVKVEGLVQRRYVRGRDGQEQKMWQIWPNTAIGVYIVPGVGRTLSTRCMYPVDFENTIYHYRWFADPHVPDEKITEYAAFHAQTTGSEDAAVASGVQKGLRSRSFSQGIIFASPLTSYTSERAVAHFHTLVRDALDGAL